MTETPEFQSSVKTSSWGSDCDGDCFDKELYAYQFLGTDSMLWRVYDYERACPFDITVEFKEKATRISDLDNNGIAETWIMYSTTCTSDVSPSTLKLIMHQGNKKYIIRGSSQPSKQMINAEYGGKYKPDAAFSTLPKAFKEYAKKLWSQFLYDYP